jgi:hypothetical protein
VFLFVAIWVELKDITLSEVSWAQREQNNGYQRLGKVVGCAEEIVVNTNKDVS